MENTVDKVCFDILNKAFCNVGLVLDEQTYQKFELYFRFLVEYNEKVNLTAITEKQDVFLKHFADSLSAVKFIPQNATVCDIGTGAGFPGVVLKLARPDIHLILVDALTKRTVFLEELLKLLTIQATVLHHRAEDKEFKEKYLNKVDVVVARAVANMASLSEYCLPFVKVGGQFIAYKSCNVTQETMQAQKAISILGGASPVSHNYRLTDDMELSLIIIKKIKPTDPKYPRGQNLPKDKPLV